MHLIIENKSKLEVFVALFQILKNWNSHINIHFEQDRLYIQSMDQSHICFADIEIKHNWFSMYNCLNSNKISVDASQMATLMNYALKHDKLEMKYEEEYSVDKIYVNFLNEKESKGEFNHFFELNLIDVEEESLGIPQLDYDVEFTIETKKMVEVISELNTFGSDLHIKCTESVIELNANGDSTKLKVNIPVDDLEEYAISEGEEIGLSFSLKHLSKLCLSMKISSIVIVSISNELPMSLLYNLGDDSKVSFYVSPKIATD